MVLLTTFALLEPLKTLGLGVLDAAADLDED